MVAVDPGGQIRNVLIEGKSAITASARRILSESDGSMQEPSASLKIGCVRRTDVHADSPGPLAPASLVGLGTVTRCSKI